MLDEDEMDFFHNIFAWWNDRKATHYLMKNGSVQNPQPQNIITSAITLEIKQTYLDASLSENMILIFVRHMTSE